MSASHADRAEKNKILSIASAFNADRAEKK